MRKILTSPTHAVLAHPSPAEAARFLEEFGFRQRAAGRLPAEAAHSLYGLDQELEEIRLDVPGATQGWIRVVQSPLEPLERNPFEPRPLAYRYHCVKSEGAPTFNPSNPRTELLRKTWSRMPSWLAVRMSSVLAKRLP